MSTRTTLPSDRLAPQAAQAVASFHPEILKQVTDTVERDAVVVVGMAQNPYVKKAREALKEAGVPFTYLEFGSYLSKWRERLAIKMWSGWPTFPQVYVRGVLLGGNSETRAALADGSLKQRLG